MKKIYFAGSITSGRNDAVIYQQIMGHAISLGWKVLTEHIGGINLTTTGESYTVQHIYQRDMAWIHEADVIIAEVTTPSLGVGYEIAMAEMLEKPVLRLFRPSCGRRLTAMVSGKAGVTIAEYDSIPEMQAHVARFLEVNA